MSKKIEPISEMSVCKFDGLDFEYQKHRVQVFIMPFFDGYINTDLSVHVDEKVVDAFGLLEDHEEEDDFEYLEYWFDFQRVARDSLSNPEFHDLLKKVVDWHLAEQKEVV